MAAGNPTRETCAAVDKRDRYCCVRCGRPIDGGSRHHRKLRRAGDHSAANLVLLCGSGTTGCHGWVHSHPKLSYEFGWMVHSWHSPVDVPILVGRSWALLDSKGYEMITQEAADIRREELGLAS